MKRAYASEPILFTSSPITSALKPSLRAFTNLRWHVLAISIAALLVSGGVMSWLLVQRSSASTNTIPSEIRNAVTFSLYEPGWLPQGFTVDRASYTATHQAVTFTVDYVHDQELIVSEQPQPPLVNFDEFYNKQFEAKTSFDTSIGQAVVGTSKGFLFGSVATGQTWVFIKAPATMSRPQFERIMQNLHVIY